MRIYLVIMHVDDHLLNSIGSLYLLQFDLTGTDFTS